MGGIFTRGNGVTKGPWTIDLRPWTGDWRLKAEGRGRRARDDQQKNGKGKLAVPVIPQDRVLLIAAGQRACSAEALGEHCEGE